MRIFIKKKLKLSETRFWKKNAQMELPFGKRKRNQMINEGIANRVKKARNKKPRKTK